MITQKPPYNNPLKLRIGATIRFNCYTDFEYDDKGKRCKVKKPVSGVGYVCGCVKKAEGAYHSSRGSMFDYEPPEFKATKYHWLYECRQSIAGKTFLVSPEDIIV